MSVTPELFIQTRALCKQVALPGNTLNILTDINLTINKGDSVAIVGASGSGKSTLLNLIAGFMAPSEGEISLDGRVVTGPGADRSGCRCAHSSQ